MVKGVSRQVIVVQSPDRELFEQAIFILKDGKSPVNDAMLIREANRILTQKPPDASGKICNRDKYLWLCFGAMFTGIIWLLSILL